MEHKPKIIVVVGPTASGKSALAVQLAQQFNGEVISADSRQVYIGLNIGTGKITQKETQGVPHHLLDVADPKTVFTADDFVRLGRKAVDDILSRGKLPIIAGGTGFYIDALVGTIILPNVPPNEPLRAELAPKTTEELLAMLHERDAVRAEAIDPYNRPRIIRALEIAEALGASPEPQSDPFYNALWIGIRPAPEVLQQKIHDRLIERLEHGMLDEAKRLNDNGLTFERMKELGLEYRHMARFLENEVSEDDMKTELETNIRQYAKRQLTYWQRNKDIRWFTPEQTEEITTLTRSFLNPPTT